MSVSDRPVEPEHSRILQSPALFAGLTSTAAQQAWGITEGAAGMVSQVRGLAQAVGLPHEIKNLTLRMPWKKLWPGFIPVSHRIFAQPEQIRCTPAPRLVISCGRQAVMASLWLKARLGDKVFTVHIQDPKIRTTRFDMVVAPEHDGLTGPNVFCSRGALHHVHRGVLQAAAASPAAAQLKSLNAPFVTVLLGGPNNCYRFTPTELAPLVESLKQAVSRQNVRLAVLPSRRTPPDVVQLFQQAFGAPHFVWDRSTENPYMAALALCSHLVVTGDSVSMVSEGAATEKPLYVFHLPEKRRSRRFRRFHDRFAADGISRPFIGQFDDWTYSSPNPTQQIADLIRSRLGEPDVFSARSAA
ncbi:mitochondrial fission ELM1 family protein [Planctomicrobium piriforme]|uniref:Nucleoside-diphosphate sugar epimerase n=1 Tax=Planctomicrobium piriforme TaxID=1576369 RepID=A0A1I3T8K7_9PLAN|nr:mitochondrial fission ELM1 family protein [Planctomicrobium piriforme]SFJ66649.1 hypothetical protein SAMN05421753_1289 [Planctomicrobium piriforme]